MNVNVTPDVTCYIGVVGLTTMFYTGRHVLPRLVKMCYTGYHLLLDREYIGSSLCALTVLATIYIYPHLLTFTYGCYNMHFAPLHLPTPVNIYLWSFTSSQQLCI